MRARKCSGRAKTVKKGQYMCPKMWWQSKSGKKGKANLWNLTNFDGIHQDS